MTEKVPTSTPPKPRRPVSVSVRVAAVIALIVLLPAGVLLGVECWRQHDIQAARNELRAAATRAKDLYGEVDDWNAWYVARTEAPNGSKEFRAWGRAVKVDTERLGDAYSVSAYDLRLLLGGHPAKLPAKPALAEFLGATDQLATEGDNLLRFASLNGVPEVHPPFSTDEWLDGHPAIQMLEERVLCNAFLGNLDAAWKDLARYSAIVDRLRYPAERFELLFCKWCELDRNHCYLLLCRSGPPPDDFVIQAFDSSDLYRRILETELAFYVEEPGRSWWDISPTLKQVQEDRESWFGWLSPEVPLDEVGFQFRGGASSKRWDTEYVEGAVSAIRAIDDGKPLPILPSGVAQHVNNVWELECCRTIWGERISLVRRLREAEAQGTSLVQVAVGLGAYPNLKATVTEDHWVIQWVDSPEVRAAFDVETGEALPEYVLEPYTLYPAADTR